MTCIILIINKTTHIFMICCKRIYNFLCSMLILHQSSISKYQPPTTLFSCVSVRPRHPVSLYNLFIRSNNKMSLASRDRATCSKFYPPPLLRIKWAVYGYKKHMAQPAEQQGITSIYESTPLDRPP
jgi:hypothetical protein